MDRSELTKAQRWYIAQRLAEDRLEIVNSIVKDVIPRESIYTKYVKRSIDIAVSLCALTVTAPINIVIAVITYFDVGRPILFRQERLGKDGKLFTIYKFRNMKNTRDERGDLLPPSQRVTKVGKFIRKTSLDELLNFWSILKGDMSIIGPRPLLPEHLIRFNKRHKMRMAVRPGLECPPRKDMKNVWTWHEQFENDVWYVEHISFTTDLYMFWRLIRFSLDRKSVNVRGAAKRGIFTGYDMDGNAITLEQVPQSYIDECEELKEEDNEYDDSKQV